jgi:hypothetical protein
VSFVFGSEYLCTYCKLESLSLAVSINDILVYIVSIFILKSLPGGRGASLGSFYFRLFSDRSTFVSQWLADLVTVSILFSPFNKILAF